MACTPLASQVSALRSEMDSAGAELQKYRALMNEYDISSAEGEEGEPSAALSAAVANVAEGCDLHLSAVERLTRSMADFRGHYDAHGDWAAAADGDATERGAAEWLARPRW